MTQYSKWPYCQEPRFPNTPSRVAFSLRMHQENVSSSLTTHWSKSSWVHCWFEYNVRAPWLQATECLLYSEGDLMAIALEPNRNLNRGSRAHAPIANDDLLLIVWYNTNVIPTNWSALLFHIDATVHLRWKVIDQFNSCFWFYLYSYVTKYIVTHKPHTPHCTQSHFFYFTICTSSAIQ